MNVIQAWTWTLHIADEDDEWAAVCGESDPELLTERGSQPPLPGYSICRSCQALTNGADTIESRT